MNSRNYNPLTDYQGVLALYKDSSTFGGQYADARDTEVKLSSLIEDDPRKLLVAEVDGKIVGTVTLFEDGRAAWLYRFAVQEEDRETITEELYKKACLILKEMGHEEVLVYAPAGDNDFEKRYTSLGMKKGGDYTAYWSSL